MGNTASGGAGGGRGGQGTNEGKVAQGSGVPNWDDFFSAIFKSENDVAVFSSPDPRRVLHAVLPVLRLAQLDVHKGERQVAMLTPS